MDDGTSNVIWQAVIALYRAGELQQAALEHLANSAPPDVRNAVAPQLAEAQEALFDAFRLFRITPDTPGEEASLEQR